MSERKHCVYLCLSILADRKPNLEWRHKINQREGLILSKIKFCGSSWLSNEEKILFLANNVPLPTTVPVKLTFNEQHSIILKLNSNEYLR